MSGMHHAPLLKGKPSRQMLEHFRRALPETILSEQQWANNNKVVSHLIRMQHILPLTFGLQILKKKGILTHILLRIMCSRLMTTDYIRAQYVGAKLAKFDL